MVVQPLYSGCTTVLNIGGWAIQFFLSLFYTDLIDIQILNNNNTVRAHAEMATSYYHRYTLIILLCQDVAHIYIAGMQYIVELLLI